MARTEGEEHALAGAAASHPPAPFSAFESSRNMQPLGFSERAVPPTGPGVFDSDLAFWKDLAIQGNYEGFRILDISSPSKPREIVHFDDCVQGATTGNQGDMIVWDDVLVRLWKSAAPAGGAFCGDLFAPEGQEGLHILDISNPRHPEGIAFVPVTNEPRATGDRHRRDPARRPGGRERDPLRAGRPRLPRLGHHPRRRAARRLYRPDRLHRVESRSRQGRRARRSGVPLPAGRARSDGPAPLVPTQLGGDWSTYYYNGRIYESDITRGLIIWNLSGKWDAGALRLPYLNPQTSEFTIR